MVWGASCWVGRYESSHSQARPPAIPTAVMSTGAHFQPACTYLEKHMSKFMGCNLNEMVTHTLWASKEKLSAEEKLAVKVVPTGTAEGNLTVTRRPQGRERPHRWLMNQRNMKR